MTARIVVVDPAARLGLGLAYSTPSMQHLLNVPAAKMTALPDEPNHFLEWLKKHYDASTTASEFVPRAVFGRYIQWLIDSAANVEHMQGTVVDCVERRGRRVLSLADGRMLAADWVVLATGNFDPAPLPGVSQAAIEKGLYCHSAWAASTYENLDPDASVILIGSGLTAVDVWLRLREPGHVGTVRMISRHGALPYPHAACEALRRPVMEGKAPQRVREQLRAVHQAIRSGLPWRAVVDSLRERTNELWLALPTDEQRRFKRHLQRRWDVVRHRMAPEIARRLAEERQSFSVEIARGRVLSVDAADGGALVVTKDGDGKSNRWTAARVINCTGPNLYYVKTGSELLSHLLERGDVVPGPLGGGLWSDEEGALRAKSGEYSQVLFNIGPGRQGVLLESIAVPELREQAYRLAAKLAAAAENVAREENCA